MQKVYKESKYRLCNKRLFCTITFQYFLIIYATLDQPLNLIGILSYVLESI